ncbi:transcription termination factor MTERF [Salix suchowensis]|nr:transcription termination factor MTERF [Salix suchowensis]
MLSCPHHHHPLHFHHHRNRNSTTILQLSSSDHHHDRTPQNPATTTTITTNDKPILRTHNSKSISVFTHLLKSPNQTQNKIETAQDVITPEERVKLQELTLATKKRIPRFPGSVFPTKAESLDSPLQTLFRNRREDEYNSENDDDFDEEMVVKAIEIRRKVTAEIFKQAMRKKGKFGITYSTNLVNRLDDFVDFIMIKAAAMKRIDEFKFLSFNDRARRVIEELNVVPHIRWLKHNAVSYPRIAKLICMSRGNVESIRRVTEWLKSIHVKGEFLGSVLTKAGENILERPIEELDEIVWYLESNGVRMDWMGYVMSRCPQLLCCSMEEVKTRVGFFLDMGMNERDFGTMVFDYPRVLGYFTLEEMNQKVNYLKEFGLSNEDVGRLLAFKPQLMGCSIEERWKPLVKYLYYLGISRDGMKECLSLNQWFSVQFFQDIGIRDDAIGNMLVKFPPLLTYSLHKKIRPVVIFLMTKAGVSERNIAKTIALGPELLGCNIVNKLEINLKYLLSLGIRHRQLGEMIADFPMLLRYNIDLFRPKYKYLRRTMVRPLQDLIEFPRFFSYSLDERIIPRHKVLVENRINFKLRYMLASTDEEFQKKVESAVERRRKFESGLMGDNSQVSDADSSEEETDVLFPETENVVSSSPKTLFNFNSLGSGDSENLD